MNAAVSDRPPREVLVVGLLRLVVAVVFGPVDLPDDRELPRLGAPFLTVMALTLVAQTTLFTEAPRDSSKFSINFPEQRPLGCLQMLVSQHHGQTATTAAPLPHR